MECEIATVDPLKSQTIHELQQLVAPEKEIVRVRVTSILGSSIEKPANAGDSEAGTLALPKVSYSSASCGAAGVLRPLIVCAYMCTVGARRGEN
jgi:hypothetical protein